MRRFYDLGIKASKSLIEEALKNKGFYKVGVRDASENFAKYERVLDINNVKSRGFVKEIIIYSNTREYKDARKLVEQGKIDILEDVPFIFFKHAMDYVLIKLMAENNVVMSFNLSFFLELDEYMQVKYIRKGIKLMKLANKYNVKVIVVSGAQKKQDLRYARDLAAFYYLMDESVERSLKAISDNPEWLIKKVEMRNKRLVPGIYEG